MTKETNIDQSVSNVVEMDISDELQQIITDNMFWLKRRSRVRQADLAKSLGISQPTLSQKYSRTVAWTINDLAKAAVFFKVPVSYLVTDNFIEPSSEYQSRHYGETDISRRELSAPAGACHPPTLSPWFPVRLPTVDYRRSPGGRPRGMYCILRGVDGRAFYGGWEKRERSGEGRHGVRCRGSHDPDRTHRPAHELQHHPRGHGPGPVRHDVRQYDVLVQYDDLMGRMGEEHRRGRLAWLQSATA